MLANWDKIKRETKEQKSDTEVLRSITPSLPALMRAEKLGKKARKMGFDFDDAEEAMQKVYEEVNEVSEALKTKDQAQIEEEFGDLLFSAVNSARKLGIDSEKALTFAVDKFISRFAEMESEITQNGGNVAEMTMEELDKVWEIVKKRKNNK